jgi:hypothetical protein
MSYSSARARRLGVGCPRRWFLSGYIRSNTVRNFETFLAEASSKNDATRACTHLARGFLLLLLPYRLG